ncbi:hypothetical protein [Acidimangrovimonas sediminis]|uniref:hypothetical protein n=1 Tax=Acidimangrovimonas sediminis TaxID=2056283 RepID=UPI0011AF5165|nr:hypothetical protein [Acidimangrovimonas sediminis]
MKAALMITAFGAMTGTTLLLGTLSLLSDGASPVMNPGIQARQEAPAQPQARMADLGDTAPATLHLASAGS